MSDLKSKAHSLGDPMRSVLRGRKSKECFESPVVSVS